MLGSPVRGDIGISARLVKAFICLRNLKGFSPQAAEQSGKGGGGGRG